MPDDTPTAPHEYTVLWFGLGDRVILGFGAPLIGGLLGFALPHVASWTASLPWVPSRGPLELIGSWSQWWVHGVFVGVGALLGLAFLIAVFYETARVTVSRSQVRLTESGDTRRVDRHEVAAVFVDGKDVVLLDATSRQLIRVRTGEKRDAVEAAFRRYDYPVTSTDPYDGLYHLWVSETPGLPAEVNAVMRAREMALKKRSSTDARELRRELDRLGVVVRDDKTRQYWRPLVRS